MSGPPVQVRSDYPSGTIVINRPECRNALSRNMIVALRQAFTDLYQEKRVRCVILTGSASAFCAGLDLREIQQTSTVDNAQQVWMEDAQSYRSLLDTIMQYPKPVIAAVNGPAYGGGVGLLLASDIVIAANTATLCIPAPRRGLVAGLILPLLAFRLGGSHAAHLSLTAKSIDAAEAHRVGAVHEIVDESLVWARAHEVAGEVAEGAHEALAMTKRMLNETVAESLSTMFATGAAMTATAKTTEAAQEGVQAFLEKRPPNWQ